MKKYGILIGVEEYRDKMISRLQFACADAIALAERLCDRCGFDDVRLLADPCGENVPDLVNIVTALRDMAAELQQEDLFLFFFAGHGVEKDGHGYLLARDSPQAFPEHGSLSLELLRKTFERLNAGKRIILLDACRNCPDAGRSDAANCMGDAISRDIVAAARSRLTGSTTTALLSACRSGQRAYEWPARRHGVFTQCLIEGLDGAAWDGSQLEFSRLASHAAKQVRQWSANTAGLPTPQEPWYEQFGDPESILLAEGPCPPAAAAEVSRPKPPRTVQAKRAALWWVVIDGQERGPLDITTVQDEIRQGHISRSAAGWREGMGNWRPMGELDEWANLFPPLREAPPVVRPPKRTSSIVLPGFLEPVSDATYAPLGGLNAGSEAAQKLQRQWVDKGYPLELKIAKVGIVLRLVPPGEFLMGSPVGDSQAYDPEKPQHKVAIDRPMYVGKFPVTQEQWLAVMGTNPSRFQKGAVMEKGSILKAEERIEVDTKTSPVENVSWNDCQGYLKRLHDRLDLEFGKVLRLLTEAQWEYACRAGTSVSRYGEVDAVAWYDGNSGGITHPVGQKSPNAWGLYDMLGNVWEWCEDPWHGDYKNAPTDGSVWQGGEASRIVRGGSWFFYPWSCRSPYRDWFTPVYRGINLGFRVVYSIEN